MNPIKILIADDHQIILDGMLAFLEKEAEIEVVHVANNGEEALEKLQRQAVDVAVLDINMPKMDGLDTARQILQRYDRTKVLFLTMFGESQFLINALKVGVHGYVLKEKSKEYLVGAIHAVYRGASYWSPEILARISDGKGPLKTEEEPVQFTQREQEVLCMMVANPGYTSEAIGNALDIARFTVDTHIRNMKAKIKAGRRQELVAYALKMGMCE